MKAKSFYIQTSLIVLICILVVLIIAFSKGFNSQTKSVSAFKDNSETGLTHNVEEANCFCITNNGDFIIGSANAITTISSVGENINTIKMEQLVTALFDSEHGLYVASGSAIYRIEQDNEEKLISDLGSNAIIKSIRQDGDTMFISDAGNRLLYTFNLQGKLTKIYSFESPPSLIIVSSWFDFVILPNASFLITNPGNHQMDLYSKDGSFVRSIPESEDTVLFEGCCNPLLLEQIADDKVVTWEKGVKRIRIFDFDSDILDEIYVDVYFQTELDIVDMTYQDGILYLLDKHKIYSLQVKQ